MIYLYIRKSVVRTLIQLPTPASRRRPLYSDMLEDQAEKSGSDHGSDEDEDPENDEYDMSMLDTAVRTGFHPKIYINCSTLFCLAVKVAGNTKNDPFADNVF